MGAHARYRSVRARTGLARIRHYRPGVAAADDAVFRDLLRLIDQFGWAVRHVGAGAAKGEAAFTYTVGLTAMQHPEVVVTGLPSDVAKAFLNNIGQDVREGKRFSAGLVTDGLTTPSAPVVFIRADDVRGLTAVAQVYGRVEALQMVWPDSTGRLPWVQGYKNPPEAQPLLGDPPDHR